MFEVLTDSFRSAINKIRFSDDEKSLKNALENLKKALLKADVHHKLLKIWCVKLRSETKLNGIGQANFYALWKDNWVKF